MLNLIFGRGERGRKVKAATVLSQVLTNEVVNGTVYNILSQLLDNAWHPGQLATNAETCQQVSKTAVHAEPSGNPAKTQMNEILSTTAVMPANIRTSVVVAR